MSKKNQKPKPKAPPTSSQSKAPDGPPKFEISKESSEGSSNQNVSYDSSFIQIGNLKFSNLDLNNLVRKSGSNEKDLTDDPDFMKKLDAYASEQSQAIMDSTVKVRGLNCMDTVWASLPIPRPTNIFQTLPSATEILEKFPVQLKITRLDEDVSQDVNLTRPSKSNDAATQVTYHDRVLHLLKDFEPSKPKRPVRIYKSRNKKVLLGKSTFVNPAGEDTPYFPEKADMDLKTFQESELESSKLRERKYPSLDTQKLYYKHPIEIAREILSPNFKYSFPFKMEIMMSTTGISRQFTWFIGGPNSYSSFKNKLTTKICEGDNFQLFYQNFDRRYMEIHDNLSFKQMCITHGAFMRGYHCPYQDTVARILCVPCTTSLEEYIFDREADMVMGKESWRLQHQKDEILHYMSFHLTPQACFEKYYRHTVFYSDEENARFYNRFLSARYLIEEIQRPRNVDELFAKYRPKQITRRDMIDALIFRYNNPYDQTTPEESVQDDHTFLMDALLDSKHQTRMSYNQLKREMVDPIRLIKEVMAEREETKERKRQDALHRLMGTEVTQIRYEVPHEHTSGPHTVKHIPNPALLQLHRAEAPQTLTDLMTGPDAHLFQVGDREDSVLPVPHEEFPSIIRRLANDADHLQKDVHSLMTERNVYNEYVRNPMIMSLTKTLMTPPFNLQPVENPPSSSSPPLTPEVIERRRARELRMAQEKEDERVRRHMESIITVMQNEGSDEDDGEMEEMSIDDVVGPGGIDYEKEQEEDEQMEVDEKDEAESESVPNEPPPKIPEEPAKPFIVPEGATSAWQSYSNPTVNYAPGASDPSVNAFLSVMQQSAPPAQLFAVNERGGFAPAKSSLAPLGKFKDPKSHSALRAAQKAREQEAREAEWLAMKKEN
ncbi:hypothetical protein B9Z55_021796 [Caenorhabditis nigoni]|uniref:Uncharacterized protein n=1 Tax=Caenorhabditis nigoni TaxID=1611254 RepID=A0A2G5TTI9_9PELO|nr:hypothetical protein B9Z55_021796 [Caenorhabditis nigoni]